MKHAKATGATSSFANTISRPACNQAFYFLSGKSSKTRSITVTKLSISICIRVVLTALLSGLFLFHICCSRATTLDRHVSGKETRAAATFQFVSIQDVGP